MANPTHRPITVDPAAVRYEAVTTIAGYHEVEALQAAVWGLDPLDVVPLHMLLTAHKNEGVLLGAREPGGEMVGFVFGFLGRRGSKLRHCSHMAGVLSEYRHLGIGEELKWQQAAAVRAQGLDLITWTFDPLQAPNARLNFRKLGCVCRTFIHNLYGVMNDAINQGTDSDRLNVEWWVDSERVRRRRTTVETFPSVAELRALGAEAVVQADHPTGRPLWGHPELHASARPDLALIEIPADFQLLKDMHPSMATEWRAAVREAHQALYAAGYVTADFVVESGPEGRRGYYLLQPGDTIELPDAG